MSEKTYYGNIKSPTGGRHDLILYLSDIKTIGAGYTNEPIESPEALVKFVQGHPEITAVSFSVPALGNPALTCCARGIPRLFRPRMTLRTTENHRIIS